MSDLKELREHAVRLAESAHVDDCERIHRITKLIKTIAYDWDFTLSCINTSGHDSHTWISAGGIEYDCPGLCGGCMTERERALWRQLAGEITEYLDQPDDEQQEALPL
jgi:hypothetical protein